MPSTVPRKPRIGIAQVMNRVRRVAAFQGDRVVVGQGAHLVVEFRGGASLAKEFEDGADALDEKGVLQDARASAAMPDSSLGASLTGTARPSQGGSTSARQARRSTRLRSHLAAQRRLVRAEHHEFDALDRTFDVAKQDRFVQRSFVEKEQQDAGQWKADEEGGAVRVRPANELGGSRFGGIHRDPRPLE